MSQASPKLTTRRLMRAAGFATASKDPLVFSAADNTSGRTYPSGDTPASRKFVQLANQLANEVEQSVPGARTRVEVMDQWVRIHVTLPKAVKQAAKAPKAEPKVAKKSPQQLDREIAEVLAKPLAAARKIGYGLSAIDEDEWSWSVEALRDGQTTWGTGSDTIAQGVEYSRGEAVTNIKKELGRLGVAVKDAVALPF